MAKNKGNDFQNKAGRRFKNPEKIDQMSQQDIFEILDEDIDTILEQVTNARNHTGKYPVYMQNAFANLSTSLWFQLYVKENCKVKKGKLKTDLSDDQIESLKTLIADAYKRSATNQYSQQTQEFKDRNDILGKTFKILSPKVYELTKKLKLSKSQRRDLTIQIYGDPVNNMRFIHKIFNHSPIAADKKKIKLCRKMYGKKRFIEAVGAAMTVDSNNSDFIVSLYEFMMKKKKKKRAPYLLAYARAYKKNKSSNYRLSGGEFYKKNRDIIKELKDIDIGFKKAFKNLKPKKDVKKTEKPKKDKEPIGSKKFSIS